MNRIDSDMVDEMVRMLSNDCSEQEKKAFHRRCHEDVLFKQCFERIQKIWNSSANLDVASRLNAQCDEEWEMFRQKCFGSTKKGAKGVAFSKILRFAAVVIALFSIGVTAFLFRSQIVESSWQQLATNLYVDSVRLDDQSVIVMNKASRIKYRFNDGQRLVRLDGMAFFKVAKDSHRPFVVKLNHSEVKVLGTSFFIENLKERDRVVVEVAEGRVEFSNKHQKVILLKGQKAVLENGMINHFDCEAQNIASWEKGRLSFQAANLSQVVDQLMTYYPEILKVNQLSLAQDTVKVTTVFDNQPLTDVLDELKIHFGKNIHFSDGELTISD